MQLNTFKIDHIPAQEGNVAFIECALDGEKVIFHKEPILAWLIQTTVDADGNAESETIAITWFGQHNGFIQNKNGVIYNYDTEFESEADLLDWVNRNVV